jgi:hypothetical protein
MTAPRTLPIRLDALPGEALDSWLEALAHRLGSPLGDVLSHLGFPVRNRSGNQLKDIPADWTIALRVQEADAVAHASGLTTDAIAAMTLAAYDQRALRIDADRRLVDRRVLWGRGRGSRFCPLCLARTGGRWPLSWRLGWSFACPHHQCLLADCCPSCGRVQRERPRSGRVVPQPGICGNPPSRLGRAPWGGCGFDLTETTTLQLCALHPALVAQERLLEIIGSGTAAFGVYTMTPQPVCSALADIRAIAARVLADLPARDLEGLLPADLASGQLAPGTGNREARRTGQRPGFMAPRRAVSVAVGVTAALQILEQADVHQAGHVMRRLLEAMREELWQISATSIDSWGRGLSPVLHAVHLAALVPSLRPSDQLRFRTASTMPARPKLTDVELARRARAIPATFWPSWIGRLAPQRGIHPNVAAPVLAGALLIIGSRATLDDAARLLGAVADRFEISRVLQLLSDQPQWPDMMTALVRLADYLDSHEVPIDYQRRRRLDYTGLLPHELWSQICRRTGALPGGGRRERVVRARLFHHISGLPAESAPGYREGDAAPFRVETARSALRDAHGLATELEDAAADFLAGHGIREEMVAWQPPAILLDGLDLPGPDIARVDVRHPRVSGRRPANPPRPAGGSRTGAGAAGRHALLHPPSAAVRSEDQRPRAIITPAGQATQ